MMLFGLLIWIGLIVVAWKKDWKSWALMPVVIPLIIGFFCGLFGLEFDTTKFQFFYSVCFVWLLYMAIKKPKPKPTKDKT